jgi:ADP-ribose pyrophosphatase YjhB (NUDIX family)
MEKKILELFLYNHKLKFNEIEKLTKIRSNKASYHLKKLIDKKIIKKVNDFYELSEDKEEIIPYLTNKKAVLPVILIALQNKKHLFLCKRIKRPFKDKFGLPGGRILVGESISEATERIMKEKYSIKSMFKKINSISLEHVRKGNKIVHSFLLIFVTANSKDDFDSIEIEKNREKIISSDYNLIKNYLYKETKINNIFSRT